MNADNDTAGGIEFIPNTEQQISGAKTYELRATIAGAPAVGDSLNTNIAQPSSFVASVAAFAINTAVVLLTTMLMQVLQPPLVIFVRQRRMHTQLRTLPLQQL